MSQKELHMRPKKKEAKLIKDYDCIISGGATMGIKGAIAPLIFFF